jgi:hypothetical protein
MSVPRHLLARLAPLLVLACGSAAAFLGGALPGPPPGADPAFALLPAGAGFAPVAGSLRWTGDGGQEPPRAFEWRTAVFLARDEATGLGDLWVADLRLAADGSPREVRRPANLSSSADADEVVLEAAGDLVACAARGPRGFEVVHLLDLGGEPERLTADWPWNWRLANRVTNFQRTGRARGVGRTALLLREPAPGIELSFTGTGALAVGIPDGRFEVDAQGRTASDAVAVQPAVKGRPAALAWAVDTVRAVPWIGRHGIEWLERYWFRTSDWLARVRYGVLGDGSEAEEPAPGEEILLAEATGIPGWPPPNLEPRLPGGSATEGVWVPADDGGLFLPRADGPPLFFQTHLKVDPERPFARVHMVAWDPSLVELGIMAGTNEPISTTGLRGAGEVPRTSEDGRDVSRLVGAFNGAFQALHGEWGMVLDRRAWLPPRAYGATVARYDDSSVAFGSWPHPVGDLPEGMRDLRQNVNALVEDGVLNPYQRVWWGGVPQGVEERVFTVRSGLCLTFGGKLIYFWGEHQSPETLGTAMIAAGCDYGLHLDMNSGHCGFEFYRVDPAGGQPALPRPLEKGEAEGPVPRRADLSFRARKLAPGMAHMRFPRYVGRDPRDFFYLLDRPSVFDDPPAGLEGGWTARGAAEGFPVPIVSGHTRWQTEIVRIDPSQVEFSIEDERPGEAPLALPFAVSGADGAGLGLVRDGEVVGSLRQGAAVLGLGRHRAEAVPPERAAEERTALQGLPLEGTAPPGVIYGLGLDRAGRLVVAEGTGDAAALRATLEDAGVRDGALLPPSGTAGRTFWLVARPAGVKSWRRIFEEVEPVPPRVWRDVNRRRGNLLDHPDGGVRPP